MKNGRHLPSIQICASPSIPPIEITSPVFGFVSEVARGVESHALGLFNNGFPLLKREGRRTSDVDFVTHFLQIKEERIIA